jgi:plasmid stability protein
MNQVTISNVDDHIVQGLKQIAWRHGVPFDESLRRLLSDAVEQSPGRIKATGIGMGLPPETD